MHDQAANGWRIGPVPVGSADGVALLREYYTEIVGRYWDRVVGDAEVDAAMADEPNDDLAPPGGQFLVARRAGRPAGCVGCRLLDARTAEVSRMFVHRDARRLGGGSLLLAAVEWHAALLGARRMRLDTRHDLWEARRLYTRHGYLEIPAYSDSPYAEHWFEKQLAR